MARLAALHPRNNTFPAEVLLELAGEAIDFGVWLAPMFRNFPPINELRHPSLFLAK
jgi:hypothetical protein